MLSFLKGRDPPRRITASQGTVYYEESTSWQEFHPPGSEYLLTHGIPNNKSFFNPPLHLHLFQTEAFRCTKGTGIWYQPTATPSKQRTVLRAGESVYLPAGTFHRFENPSESEELVVDIKINPESTNATTEERFFRNFFGYLEDCRVAGTAPSIFQLELFLWSVGGPLAIPVPGSDWLKWWVSRAFMVVLGKWIGESLLGYKTSYPEYYSGR